MNTLEAVVRELYTDTVMNAHVTVDNGFILARRGDQYAYANIQGLTLDDHDEVHRLMQALRTELDTLVARTPRCLPDTDAATYLLS